MDFIIIENCLEDYLQVLYKCGSEERQDECCEVMNKLQEIKERIK